MSRQDITAEDEEGPTSARIVDIATHLPETVLDNDALAADFPEWPADKILAKTGIRERRIAGPGETALDLGHKAAAALLARSPKLAARIDFVIFCSQAPDHVLPTSACILQDRLGLTTQIGAIDLPLGCSGFAYGLSLAKGLIVSGAARCILLVTADTYSKFIHPRDKSVRTLFGDGAAATIIEAGPGKGGTIGPGVFGTDGSGAKDLIVEAGGARMPIGSEPLIERTDAFGSTRRADNLYMNGGAVMAFSLREVPRTVERLLVRTRTTLDDYDGVLLHQANKLMIDKLQKKLGLPDAMIPRFYENVGNTVASTIPFLIDDLMQRDGSITGRNFLVVGFGVGLSWAGTTLRF